MSDERESGKEEAIPEEKKDPGEVSEIKRESEGEGTGETDAPISDGVDYSALVREDLDLLRLEFPELSEIEDITELDDPLRYAALRDLGLSPREAYLATAKRERSYDTRTHLRSAVPKFAGLPRGAMPEGELLRARELFEGLSDSEIRKLYKKVTV